MSGDFSDDFSDDFDIGEEDEEKLVQGGNLRRRRPMKKRRVVQATALNVAPTSRPVYANPTFDTSAAAWLVSRLTEK